MTTILSNGFGQDFQVPERTLEQKHNRALFFAYVNIAVGISAAKESGMSVSEYAEYVGDQLKGSWNKERGFPGLVNGTLLNYESSRLEQKSPIKIIEQDENKVVFDLKINYKGLFDNGPLFGITYEEFSLWYDIVYRQIAGHFEATYKQEELDDDMMRITLTNNK